ncbi:MAG: hypothetical protein LBQ10_07205 [Desulfovibrio sp.]|jgi:hypothetical protein|nr:hypothetical protein [Desulfovibrio sp.]
MNNSIDYHSLIDFLENSWGSFVERCGSEEAAEATLNGLKEEAGMD